MLLRDIPVPTTTTLATKFNTKSEATTERPTEPPTTSTTHSDKATTVNYEPVGPRFWKEQVSSILGVILAISLFGPLTLYLILCKERRREVPNNMVAAPPPLRTVSDVRVANINSVGQGGNSVTGDSDDPLQDISQHDYEEIRDEDINKS
ncbi:Hypp686 [Branchiostoma lanceolatum]|uniref:Hypp686 protein n=1 Tax=Branchiostoma lanceolatum TaxID=7740 RepID=A0A8J9W1E9_BRALA|nr:Hypp686 [Branchiostoma lanceolatum]